ncbi:MAG: hypothetical protein IPK87_06325 [Planctomycetes bacterium]|nr:hypothetical protein [Planctomycetota bacterium]
MSQAVTDIKDLLAGTPGSVNRLIRRYGKSVVDYCTALVPDRDARFERMVEDVLVDILAQSRAAVRSTSDDEVFEFAMQAATQTIRSRYRDVLESSAQPRKATTSFTFDEVVARTGMSREQLTMGISEGRIRAIRADDQLKIKAESVPGLRERKHLRAYHVTAAERELLCLHFRLGFSPATIGRWAGESPAHIEALIDGAARKLAAGVKSRESGAKHEDTEMRRYIDGRLDEDETAKFERKIIKDKIGQQRLDELRGQSEAIREMFDSPEFDFSRVSINVRARNPHHALSLPPSAALWVQVVGIVGMMLMFHRVGAYVAPPEVNIRVLTGQVEMPPDGRMRVGDTAATGPGAQALITLDASNRVLMAGDSKLELLRPREDARQVMRLHEGEIWGRFTAAGHAFAIAISESELGSDSGADFDVAAGKAATPLLPDNLHTERLRLLATRFKPVAGGLECTEPLRLWAGFVAETGEEGQGLKQGDLIIDIAGEAAPDLERLTQRAALLMPGEAMAVTVKRGNAEFPAAIRLQDIQPSAVVRVFQGAVILSGDEDQAAVNRGQWALMFDDAPPIVGREYENFRDLRIGANLRFKESLHWLNTESYPLRAEESLLAVDRRLRVLAQGLENLRGEEVRRRAHPEIIEFERQLQETFDAARARVDRGQGNPRGEGAAALSDSELLQAEVEIMGVVAHWRRQSGTGIYGTLGEAAKTLHSDISRGNDELGARDKQLGEAAALRKRLNETIDAIALQDAEIAKLVASEFHDADGSKRAALSKQVADLNASVRAGQQASGRLDLLKLKLNELDAKIDDQRRLLPDLTRSVEDAEAALADIEKKLAASVYTPAKLEAATTAKAAADKALAEAQTTLAELDAIKESTAAALKEAEAAVLKADEARRPLQDAKDAASDELVDALAARKAAQDEQTARQTEVDQAQAALDALPENDPARPAAEKKLQEAQAALNAATTALDQAKATAQAAEKALSAADAKLAAAAKAATDAASARDAAKTAADDAAAGAIRQSAATESAKAAAERANAQLEQQEDAKAERAMLDTRRIEAEATRTAAREALKQVQDRLAALEADAAPRREEFKKEVAIVEAGDAAKEALVEVKRERERYQAVTDEIELRGKDRKALDEERDRLANADAVKFYDRLIEEYAQLQARVRAHEYLRARALLEDGNFAHRQQLALDRFREAADKAREEAVALLAGYCPEYDAKEYDAAKMAELRPAVLSALWSLYYDAAIERSDAGGSVCYYVIIQSGAQATALGELEDRWRAYLTSALGKGMYETVSALTAEQLKPPAPEGE